MKEAISGVSDTQVTIGQDRDARIVTGFLRGAAEIAGGFADPVEQARGQQEGGGWFSENLGLVAVLGAVAVGGIWYFNR